MKISVDTNNYILPEPCIIVSCRDKNGKNNALPIGFAANVSFNPRIIMIAVIEERYSHHIIKERGEFVVNIAREEFREEMEFLGRNSGKNMDKLANFKLIDADIVDAPILLDCPVNFECKVIESVKPGTHDVFFGRVEKVHCDKELVDDEGKINWDKINILEN
ncbi:flavin reductase family protein [Methanosphaera sp. WGK6]|uniref:flavin reductase family protein n=1 Tax=Methanosphaera sp. WGK6 TaxID=1561964 RepID=UPI00084C320D|nr:flavin reductase family protein [Methanosphaera sp. WGK6]OED29631.1 flavin oxidoreductase [Methanosphaera sp. WGK6]